MFFSNYYYLCISLYHIFYFCKTRKKLLTFSIKKITLLALEIEGCGNAVKISNCAATVNTYQFLLVG